MKILFQFFIVKMLKNIKIKIRKKKNCVFLYFISSLTLYIYYINYLFNYVVVKSNKKKKEKTKYSYFYVRVIFKSMLKPTLVVFFFKFCFKELLFYYYSFKLNY